MGMVRSMREVDPRRLLAAHAAATAFYQARLPGHLPALAYLHSRGVSATTANCPPWTVGYAPAGWTELRDALHAQGFHDRELLEAGLATTSRTGAVIDVFRDRVTFAVRDRHGDVVGFTTRDLSGRPDVPKYRNTITTAIYRKKRLLFGLAEQLGGDPPPSAVLDRADRRSGAAAARDPGAGYPAGGRVRRGRGGAGRRRPGLRAHPGLARPGGRAGVAAGYRPGGADRPVPPRRRAPVGARPGLPRRAGRRPPVGALPP